MFLFFFFFVPSARNRREMTVGGLGIYDLEVWCSTKQDDGLPSGAESESRRWSAPSLIMPPPGAMSGGL